MIKEPEISPDLTVDDIHVLREYEYEKTKDMTLDEFNDYLEKRNEEAKEILKNWRERNKLN